MRLLSRSISALVILLACARCAVAPLSTHTTARTNGKGENMLTAGSTLGLGNTGWVPSLRYSVGLSDRFDVSFQYEVVQYGVAGKYNLVGNGDGFSLAALLGTGLSFDGFYGFLGPVISWKLGHFEPYFAERFNYVNYPSSQVNVDEVGEVHVDPGTYRYFQHTLGFFAWPMSWFGFGLEASLFTTVASPFILKGRDHHLYSGQVSFRF